VFYHDGGWFGKLPELDESKLDESKLDEPKTDQPKMDDPKDDGSKDSELDSTGPATAPPSVVPNAGTEFGLVTPSPFEARVQKIFMAPDGLRPVWRLVFYLLAFRALRFFLHILIAYALPDVGRLWLFLVAELGLAIIAAVPAIGMSRIEHRPFGCYGIPLRHAFGKLFWFGALWGFGSITLLLLALHGANAFDFGGLALHGARVLNFALFWGAFFLIVGFYEEFLTRGYTQFTLTQSVGFWPAAVLLSAGFGALHLGNPGESWVGILGAVLIGFFFCLTLRRTGNLWFAIGFHTSWDWGESYFYSVPDSGGMAPGHLLHSSFHGPSWLTGGSVGPEGSVFLFVLLVLLWVVFDRVYREVKYPQRTT
jgi:membrane protease YdiL (CAAX protease family)